MVNWTIFNNPKRLDKRNVAVAGAIYANIHTDWIRFFDRQDPQFFQNVAEVREGAIGDGFDAFANKLILEGKDIRVADLLDLWDFCRYLRQRAEDDDETWDLFVHDDIYVRRFGNHIVTEHFLAWVSKEHLTKQVAYHGLERFAFLLFPLQPYEMDTEVSIKTGYCFVYNDLPFLNQKAMLLSQHGAKVILQRLLARLQAYHNVTNGNFTNFIYDTDRWNPLGGFATDEPLFAEYPDDFLGEDTDPIKTAYQGEFERLFQGYEYYEIDEVPDAFDVVEISTKRAAKNTDTRDLTSQQMEQIECSAEQRNHA